MSEEERQSRLYEEGLALVRKAIEDHVSKTELRNIYSICQTKTIAFLKAYVQMQTGRKLRSFGRSVLDLISKHGREDLLMVLKYANMTYDYERRMQDPGERGRRLSPEVESRIKAAIRDRLSENEVMEVRGVEDTGTVQVYVRLRTFPRGNPGILAKEISQVVRTRVDELGGKNVRVRFEGAERR